MKFKATKLKGAALLAVMLAAPQHASAASPFMEVTGGTTQPIGHYELCQRLPSECRQLRQGIKPVKLAQDVWARIIEVNAAVNSLVRPVTDMEMWGKEEVWSYPSNKGDCEDYVLLKRKLLMKSGIAENNLLITVVRQMDGSGHAVLTVRTDRGDFILDNLQGEVKLWSATNYAFLKRQSDANSGRWIGVEDARAEVVAALR
jgi:predicted transglutaminase-like cysteine proteinase